MASTPAVFVFTADDDLLVFTSLGEAASYMEVPDVDDGEYPAIYTDEGGVVIFTLDADTVVLTETGRFGLDDLSARLARVAERLDLPAPSDKRAFANAMLEREWQMERHRRPRWLFKRIYGDAPPSV